jgi:hypothetical protein
MKHFFGSSIILLAGLPACALRAQGAMQTAAPARSLPAFPPDTAKTNTLPELIILTAPIRRPRSNVIYEVMAAHYHVLNANVWETALLQKKGPLAIGKTTIGWEP